MAPWTTSREEDALIGGHAARMAGHHGSWRRTLLVAGAALVIAGVLVAGIALGMSLHDNPRPTGPLTVERTVDSQP